jgi:hypothetical protein
MTSQHRIAFTRRTRTRHRPNFQIEAMERRLLLASAIAAFHPQHVFPIGTNPLALAVADVNRDGKLDLVVANNTDGNVGVLLGNGTGSFLNQQTFASGPTPIALAVADVNGDGKPDLIVANYGSSSVSVLLGNGDGTFQNPQSFATGNGPIAVTTADANGDGKPDIVVANYFGGTVSVLDGNGDGTFQPQQTFAAGAHLISIAAADLNRDGKPAIAVSNYTSSTVSVLLGTGGGAFSSPQTFAVGAHPRSVAVADINTDGKPDLVVVNKTDSTASILLGNGDGTFQAQLTSYVGSSPNAVAVADVNGDGKEDLVVADGSRTYPGNVPVLLGNRDGTFQPAVKFNTGANPYSVAVADLNDDGRLDIVAINERSNTASVLLGDVPMVLSINRASPPGPITSDSSVTYMVTFNEPVTGVDPTDFSLALNGVTAKTPVIVNGSGAVYSVTVNGVSGYGTLGLNLVDHGTIKDLDGNPLQPAGVVAFQPQQTFVATSVATGTRIPAVVVADLNRDGKPDLVVVDTNDNMVDVLLGNGNGTFESPQAFAVGAHPEFLAVGDIIGDGIPDLVVSNSYSNNVSVLLGNGNGTFKPQQTYAVGLTPFGIVVSDLNGDGRPDLVVGNVLSNSLSLLLGNGDGSFQLQQTIAAGGGLTQSSTCIAVSDLNGDGRPDLVVTNGRYPPAVFLGNGNGTFQRAQSFTAGYRSSRVAVSDLNGDGRPDLVLSNDNVPGTMLSTVSVLLGNGNGTFQPQQTYVVGGLPRAVAIADFNGDGKPDLVVPIRGNVAGGFKPALGVLLGNGDGTFQSEATFAVGTGSNPFPSCVAVSDLTNDGRPDLVAATLTNNIVSVPLAAPAVPDGSFTGQLYTMVPNSDVFYGLGYDQITLTLDPDQTHIDWTLFFNPEPEQVSINDPNGLTLNATGGNNIITLDYSNGNPLLATLHLNGTFTISGLQGINPLAGATLDIGRKRRLH